MYAALVGYVVSLHRPWFDEAQAWLIARDCDLATMFCDVLRREGHPALWYLILKAAIFLHLPYEAIGLLSGGIATMGAWLLLAKSPFPKWLAALLPFTYFLGYQYAVIARSYVLLPLLLFATAALEDKKWQWPIRWSLCLLLIGNVCVHSFGIACGLMLIHLLELGRRWRSLDPSTKKRQAVALAIWGLGMLLVVVVLWPTKDIVAAFGVNGRLSFVDLFYATLRAIDSATLECPILTAAFLAASCYWFWRNGVLLVYLIVSLPVLGIFLWLRVFDHHHGILFLVWLYVFWRSMAAFAAMRQRGGADRRRRVEWAAMMVLVAGLVVRQTVWTGQSVMLEREVSYCGAPALAKFIQAHNLTKYRIAGVRYENAAVLPYFPKNIFMNFPNEGGRCYVDWSKSHHALDNAFSADGSLSAPCDVLVWPGQGIAPIPTPWEDPELLSRLPKDWCYVAHFDGQLIYKGRLTASASQSVFARRRVAVEKGLTVMERDASRKSAYRAIPKGFSEAHWRPVHSAWFHLDFGELLSKIGPEESLRQYQFALDLVSHVRSPDLSSTEEEHLTQIEAKVHGNIGAAVAKTRPKLAIEHLWRALQLDPVTPVVYRNLAVALELVGQKQSAIEALRCALKLAPDDALANAMFRRLSKNQTNGGR